MIMRLNTQSDQPLSFGKFGQEVILPIPCLGLAGMSGGFWGTLDVAILLQVSGEDI